MEHCHCPFSIPVMDVIRSCGQTYLASDSLCDDCKSQDLYKDILENINVNIPLFHPSSSMSDWEPAARIAFRDRYPQMKVYGCWFHFTCGFG